MSVRQIMTTKLFTIRSDKKLFAAGEIMNWAHTRHVPVVDAQGRLEGIVSHRDVLRASISAVDTRIAEAEKKQHLTQITVAQVMQKPAHTIRPDATIREAAAALRAFRIGCLPVVEEGKLIGLVTAHDLLGVIAHLPAGTEADERTVADGPTPPHPSTPHAEKRAC